MSRRSLHVDIETFETMHPKWTSNNQMAYTITRIDTKKLNRYNRIMNLHSSPEKRKRISYTWRTQEKDQYTGRLHFGTENLGVAGEVGENSDCLATGYQHCISIPHFL